MEQLDPVMMMQLNSPQMTTTAKVFSMRFVATCYPNALNVESHVRHVVLTSVRWQRDSCELPSYVATVASELSARSWFEVRIYLCVRTYVRTYIASSRLVIPRFEYEHIC